MTLTMTAVVPARYEIAHMRLLSPRYKFMLYRDIYEYLGGTGVIFQGC